MNHVTTPPVPLPDHLRDIADGLLEIGIEDGWLNLGEHLANALELLDANGREADINRLIGTVIAELGAPAVVDETQAALYRVSSDEAHRGAGEKWFAQNPTPAPPETPTTGKRRLKVNCDGNKFTSDKVTTAALYEAFGDCSPETLSILMGQIVGCAKADANTAANSAISIIDDLKPADHLERMLVVQMIATHNLGMETIRRGFLAEQTTEGLDMAVNRSTKLMRTFAAQLEALARFRGKGESKQVVRVEHISITGDGTQTVIGNVDGHRGTGGQVLEGGQPHDKTSEMRRSPGNDGGTPVAALSGPDPERDVVQVPSDAERPVSIARRPITRRAARTA